MADPTNPSEPGGATLEVILRRRRRKTIRNVAIGGLLVLGAAFAWWWLGRDPVPTPLPERRTTPPATPVAPPEPAPTPVPSAVPVPTPPPPAANPAATADSLPELDTSDALVREIAGRLSSHADVMTWLATDELVRRFVAAVDNVAEGRSPRDQLAAMRPTGRYGVESDGDQLTADPAAFARYDTLTEAIVAIDTPAAVRAYRKLRPLIDEAYRDLGYPDRAFDDALRAALFELLSTPVVVGEPTLAPRVITYEYIDPELEGLSASQKQLLRMGPSNAPRVQRKLRELAAALGIPDRELPLTPLHQVVTPEPQ